MLLSGSDVLSARDHHSWLTVQDIEHNLMLIRQNVPPAAKGTGARPDTISSHRRGFEAGMRYVTTSFGVKGVLRQDD